MRTLVFALALLALGAFAIFGCDDDGPRWIVETDTLTVTEIDTVILVDTLCVDNEPCKKLVCTVEKKGGRIIYRCETYKCD